MLLPLLEQLCAAEQVEPRCQETADLLGPELTSSRGPAGMLLPLGKSSGQCCCSSVGVGLGAVWSYKEGRCVSVLMRTEWQ